MRLGKENYDKPSGDEISGLVCVKENLVVRAIIAEDSIWDDAKTGASQNCFLWAIKPEDVNSAIDSGTFYSDNNRPQNPEVKCIRKDVVIFSGG